MSPGEAMRRRDLIKSIAGAVIAWPAGAGAQQPGKIRTIGFLGATSAASQVPWTTAFLNRLAELGLREGRDVTIETRWTEGSGQRAAEIAAEFVRMKVDVIITGGNANVAAAQKATTTIPIVFAAAGDPVGTGLVASLARPGANITGLSIDSGATLSAKRIELLREVVPALRRLAVIGNAGSSGAALEMRGMQAIAAAQGVTAIMLEIRRAEDIEPAFVALKDRTEALFVVNDALVTTNRDRIIALALRDRLPTMFFFREHVAAGGLMSYGPNLPDLYRRAADLVDRVLRGTSPADIPVEQPTKFDLVVNLKTAKALGLTIPDKMLALADEVVE